MNIEDLVIFPFEFDFVICNKVTNEVVYMSNPDKWKGIPVTYKAMEALYTGTSVDGYYHKHREAVEAWVKDNIKE